MSITKERRKKSFLAIALSLVVGISLSWAEEPNSLPGPIFQDTKIPGALDIRVIPLKSENRLQEKQFGAKATPPKDAGMAKIDGSITLSFQPPFENSCYSWGQNLSLPGTAEYRDFCNQNTGFIGTYASGFIGGSTAEAMERITFLVDSPCTVTFDAKIVRIGGAAVVGLASFAGTEKTWVIDTWDNYNREGVDDPFDWQRALDLIMKFAQMLSLTGGEDIKEIIELLSEIHDFAKLIHVLEELQQAGEAEELHITDSFWATPGYHTIWVGLRSNASAFITGSAFAVSAGSVTQIAVSGTGLHPPAGACCHPQTHECVEPVLKTDCLNNGWAYAGDNVTCDQADCDHRCAADCYWCWLDTIYENNCPSEWNGAGDGCDCGCQFTDVECLPCECGNGIFQPWPPCFETPSNCPQDYTSKPGDLVALGVWLSSIPEDWDGNSVVIQPQEGQNVWPHFQYESTGTGSFPSHYVSLRIDGEELCGGYIDDLHGGYLVSVCCTDPWIAMPPDHSLCGIVDFYHNVPEPDENNNQECTSFTVKSNCPCEHDYECADGNPCTNDWCDCECHHSNNTQPCDDGVYCNGTDTCSGGNCTVHTGNPCIGGNECADQCNEAADNCFDGANASCSDDGNTCTYDWCNGHGECLHPKKAEGTACPLGWCENGICVPQPDINCEDLTGHFFNWAEPGNGSQPFTWNIMNEGGADLHGAVDKVGVDCIAFQILSGEGRFTLSPGQVQPVKVQFIPPLDSTEGTKFCQLHITSDDPDEPVCDLPMEGKCGFNLWGDCSDDNEVIDSDTGLEDDMNFRNLTVLAGKKLDTHGFTVRVCEKLINYGTITDDYSGGSGGVGGNGGHGANPKGSASETPGCNRATADCTNGLAGGAGKKGVVNQAGYGGDGGGGGGGGGGGWHGLSKNHADGGNGGAGGAGGKGGGYVKVFAHDLENHNRIHADGFPGQTGITAPEGDEDDPDKYPGYEQCGAEDWPFKYLGLKREVAGGGGGGGAGGDGGNGGTVDLRYSYLTMLGSYTATGGTGGEGGSGGTYGGECNYESITGGCSQGCSGGGSEGPIGGSGGHGCYSGGTGGCGGSGDPGSGGVIGTFGGSGSSIAQQVADCSSDTECNDGMYCNGAERCVVGHCAAGIPPSCSDGFDCTNDWCYDALAGCRFDVKPGNCLIGGVCYSAGTANPADDCKECNPLLNTSGWSLRRAGTLCGNGGMSSCDDADTCDETGLCQANHRPDGASCEDGNLCTQSGICQAGLCIGGDPLLLPSEVSDLVRVSRNGGIAIIQWELALNSTHSDILRGSLKALPVGPGGADEICFEHILGNTANDTDLPPPGSGFWYVIRGGNECGAGPYGFEEHGDGTPPIPRISTSCP